MVPACSRILLAFAFFLTVIPSVRAGDLKVVSVLHLPNGDTYTSTGYYKGERARLERRYQKLWKPGLVTSSPPLASVYQCDAQRLLDLNLKSHQYAITELDEECQRKSAPPPRPAPKGTIDVYIETTDTGERRQILGHTARHIITHQRQVAGPQACWHDAEMDTDGWYIDLPEQPICRKICRPSDEANLITINNFNCRDKVEVHRTVERPGFPVKLIEIRRSSSLQPDGTSKEYTSRYETEVTELSDAPLDIALFDLPSSFIKVAKIDDGYPETPFAVAVGDWWHRAVHTVRSWL